MSAEKGNEGCGRMVRAQSEWNRLVETVHGTSRAWPPSLRRSFLILISYAVSPPLFPACPGIHLLLSLLQCFPQAPRDHRHALALRIEKSFLPCSRQERIDFRGVCLWGGGQKEGVEKWECAVPFFSALFTPAYTQFFFFFFALVTAWLFSVPTLSPTRHSLCRKIRLSPQSGIKAQSSAQPTYEESHSWALGWSAGTCLAARQQINAAVAAVCPGENTPRILPFSPLPPPPLEVSTV